MMMMKMNKKEKDEFTILLIIVQNVDARIDKLFNAWPCAGCCVSVGLCMALDMQHDGGIRCILLARDRLSPQRQV
jgi:hypothetical protein